MPIQVVCPECNASYTVDDDVRGRKIRCRKCDHVVAVPAARPVRDESTRARSPEPPARVVPASRPAREEDERPSSRRRDEEQDRRPRRRDEEREDRGPRREPRRAKGGAGAWPWILGGCVAGVLLLGVAVTVAIKVWNGMLDDGSPSVVMPNGPVPHLPVNQQVEAPADPNPQAGAGGVELKPLERDPNLPPPVVERPPEAPKELEPAVPGQLTQRVRDRVKNATVLIKVTMPDGNQASGSGFFGVEDHVLLTNAHVIGMLGAESRPPTRIEVVLHSGEPNELTLGGSVLGVDRASDLAMLKVFALKPGKTAIPPPLEVKPATSLVETQQVFVFGFPRGEQLGKEISVRPSTVTSFRRSANGTLTKIQCEGGMTPGNSGGPVVNDKGDVIGVAVQIVLNTNISFAVPGDQVRSFVGGRITEMGLQQAYVMDTPKKPGDESKQIAMPATVKMLDPLEKVQEVAIEVWTAGAGPRRDASDEEPKPKPGDSSHARAVLTYQKGEAKGEVLLPALEPGKEYWIQPTWKTKDGKQRWAAASVHKLPVPPVERRTIHLASRAAQAQRDLAVTTTLTLAVHDAEGGEHSYRVKSDAKLHENVDLAQTGTATTLTYRDIKVDVSVDEQRPPESYRQRYIQPVERSIRSVTTRLSHDRQGNLQQGSSEYNQVPFNDQQAVQHFHEPMQHALEALAVPLPDAQVEYSRQWTARHDFTLPRLEGQQHGVMEITCTYLGVSRRNDREVAVVGLGGRVHGPAGLENQMGGGISGTAVVDLATGQAVDADIKISFDATAGQQTKNTGSLEVRLQRSGL